MNKEFGEELVRQLSHIRRVLDDMENMEDGMEMIHAAQELSADIDTLEEKVLEVFDL